MSALTSPAYEILPPSNRSAEAPPFRTFRPEDDWFADRDGDWFSDRFADRTSSSGKQASRRRPIRLVTMFLLGAAAILAWHSYGHAARETLAQLSPGLQWLAPPLEPAQNEAARVEQISRSVDRIAANVAASQEQITRTIDHLAADQEQMTREIIRLQELSQLRQRTAGGRNAARRAP
jgi:hypothetical protein